MGRLREVDGPLRQLTDHGTHLAIYLSDPDGNDLELAWDRPFDEWPRDADGHVAGAMDDELDLEALLAASWSESTCSMSRRASRGSPSSQPYTDHGYEILWSGAPSATGVRIGSGRCGARNGASAAPSRPGGRTTRRSAAGPSARIRAGTCGCPSRRPPRR